MPIEKNAAKRRICPLKSQMFPIDCNFEASGSPKPRSLSANIFDPVHRFEGPRPLANLLSQRGTLPHALASMQFDYLRYAAPLFAALLFDHA